MNEPCSFCGKNGEYEVVVRKLLHMEHVRCRPYAQLILCESCLPFSKKLEITTIETRKVKRLRDVTKADRV